MSVKASTQSNGKRPVGRPSTVSRLAPGFLKHIESGQTIVAAAALSGIGQSTVFSWMAIARNAKDGEYREFLEAFTRARGKAEGAMVQEVRKAGREDWRATAWLLERMFPERFYVKQLLEVSGPDGSPIAVSAVPTFPQVRVLTVPDDEFEQAERKPAYKMLADGSLERTEGSLRIVICRQSKNRELINKGEDS
jgi:hypothetical protein